MSNRYSEVYQRLPARHVPAFEAMLRDRSVTIAQARAWLESRGCSSSRSSVARCVKRFRDNVRLSGFCPESTGKTDRQRRENVRKWVGQLSDQELAAVALFCGTLAHAQRKE